MSEWRKPTQVMRVHQMRRRPSAKLQGDSAKESENDAGNLSDSQRQKCLQLNKKRRNPFGCNSPLSLKRSLSETDFKRNTPDPFGGSSPLTLKQRTPALDAPKDEEVGSEPTTLDNKDGETEGASPNPTVLTMGKTTVVDSDPQMSEVLPLDWSLKMKLRITTMEALQSGAGSGSGSVSTGQARALDHFVHDVPPEDGVTDSSVLSSLRRYCHYWMHPNLPWFPAFPRIVADSKIRSQVLLDVGLDAGIQKALYNDWVDSFTSVFQQLKAGLCPYFYVCCHQFTVLFRGRGIGGQATPTACVTPTTRGLRNALTQEGVDFTMPRLRSELRKDPADLSAASQSVDGLSQQCSVGDESSEAREDSHGEDGDDDDITGSNEGASVWLQDIGLDRKNFPSLEPAKVKIQREDYQRVDGKTQSLVFCQASQVQALFNFLINFRSCVALTGPQAGIPPTVIAPTAFRGATLKSNKIRLSQVKLSKGASTESGHVVEVSGPVLPHHMLNISSLLHEAVPTTAVMSVLTDEHSVPFNLEAEGLALTPSTLTSDSTGSGTAALSRDKDKSLGIRTLCDSENSEEKESSARQKPDYGECSSGTTRNFKTSVRGKPAEKENTCGDFMENRSTTGENVADRDTSSVQHRVPDKAACGVGDGWALGLHCAVRGQLNAGPCLTEGAMLREIKCQPGGFMWA